MPPRPSRRLFLGGLGALTLTAAARPATAAAGPPPRRLRGVWIATVDRIDWPPAPGLPEAQLRAAYDDLLDSAAAAGANAVFVQVRPTADAFWPSRYEPWSQWLTGVQGQDPGWDPMRFLVDAAHARGLAFHAWFNPYRIAQHDDPARLAAAHPARRHPEWAVSYGGRLYYDPGVPAARAFVEQAILDAVARYQVDGVHLDDYFYPYPVAGRPFPDDASFAAYGGATTDRAAWRRRNVDLLIRELRDLVRAARPEAAFGVSPFGIWRNAATDPRGSATAAFQSYDGLHADSLGWVQDGLLDYVAPQLYWHLGHPQADYAALARWWAVQTAARETLLWTGQAAYRAGVAGEAPVWQDPAELSRHLDLDATLPQIGGQILFSARNVRTDPIGAVARLTADHWHRPALPPLLPRLAGGTPPTAPVLTAADGTLRITPGGPPPFRYAVHRLPQAPGDRPHLTADTLAACLPAADCARPLPLPTGRYTATALDRPGRESRPAAPVQV
ncbi:family 10 glycosylhydrolase [Kitasatospora sp. NPDC093679]|uniref:glycoside hydrolase family 10 protein n=1 Tax=Kitasatospora sp. NPDC093679 TaxID=3154983 RepID=UPI003424B7D9